MKRAMRLKTILEMVAEADRIEVDDAARILLVSPATIRRDLDALASERLLVRTHGGAVANSVSYDLPMRYKSKQRAPEKNAIAAAALKLIAPGYVVGLTGGTTSTVLAGVLGSEADFSNPATDTNLTVVTNAVNIAAQLVMRPHIKVVMTGGAVHPKSYELVGPYADLVLNSITMDIAFIGVNGVDVVTGATVHDESEARVNRIMADRARSAVLIADSSKIGRRAFASVGGLALFSALITDSAIQEQQLTQLRDTGLNVIIAD